MKKWIDDIERQIEEIKVGKVDAKNLSEVLDKDAPVTLTTDLQNNKVKVGLDIDSETLEVNEGKLKVKASGGAKKYLHTMHIYSNKTTSNRYTIQVISTSNTAVQDNASLTALLDTITPIDIYGYGTTYKAVACVINAMPNATSSGDGISLPFYIIKLQYNYGILYNTVKLSDNTKSSSFSNGYGLYSSEINESVSVEDKVTEL